jgi:hypothetical protein
LDTELQSYEFRHIARVIKESPYTLEQIKKINSYEVFPVLGLNLISVAGVWSGFDEEWMIEKMIHSLKRRTKLKDLRLKLTFRLFKGGFNSYWDAVEAYLNE